MSFAFKHYKSLDKDVLDDKYEKLISDVYQLIGKRMRRLSAEDYETVTFRLQEDLRCWGYDR